jgi:hypothetical protein
MKKLVLVLLVSFCTTVLFAQKTTEVKTKDLPKATTDWVKTNMPPATIQKSIKLEDKGTVTYNVLVLSAGRKHILVFDKDGKYLQKGDDLYKAAPKGDAKGGQKK